MPEKEDKRKAAAAAERAARERYEVAVAQLKEGGYRFSSKVRGQAGLVLDELIDPDGEAVATLADVEGDVGALALAMPLDLITFETWILGQIGDEEELDLDLPGHRELWFNFGAWIGDALRLRHGGHWLILGDEPKTWRLGFSKVLLEVVPHTFAEQLLRMGPGLAKKMVSEIERLRITHDEQKDKDEGVDIDRFTPQHYFRMHTMPLGQWMVMDLALLDRLWNRAAARDLVKEVRKAAKRLGEANQPVVDKVIEALGQANQDQPLSGQTGDRGLFEAVAQIVALRRTTAPIAMDVIESYVMPAMHIGIPDKFPPLDDDDLAQLRRGIELFALFVDIIPHKYQADDEGFLGAIPHDDLLDPVPRPLQPRGRPRRLGGGQPAALQGDAARVRLAAPARQVRRVHQVPARQPQRAPAARRRPAAGRDHRQGAQRLPRLRGHRGQGADGPDVPHAAPARLTQPVGAPHAASGLRFRRSVVVGVVAVVIGERAAVGGDVHGQLAGLVQGQAALVALQPVVELLGQPATA